MWSGRPPMQNTNQICQQMTPVYHQVWDGMSNTFIVHLMRRQCFHLKGNAQKVIDEQKGLFAKGCCLCPAKNRTGSRKSHLIVPWKMLIGPWRVDNYLNYSNHVNLTSEIFTRLFGRRRVRTERVWKKRRQLWESRSVAAFTAPCLS